MHQTFPKPEPHRRLKARVKRQERAVATHVRQQTVERDGRCVIASRVPWNVAILLGPCKGASQWAHVEDARRFKTRGMAPEERHTTAGSCQMCETHHAAYDAHVFDLDLHTAEGMNGSFSVVRRAA